jgi:TPR repeat protein
LVEDRKLAIHLYHLAIKQGHVEATRQLGLSFLNGIGTVQDAREAKRFLKDAVDKGSTEAIFDLAYCYSELGDKLKAAEAYRKAADMGLPRGHYDSGRYLCRASGKSQAEKDEGARLIGLAADQGIVEAMAYMGVLCEEANKRKEAIEWYTLAGQERSPLAMNRLQVLQEWELPMVPLLLCCLLLLLAVLACAWVCVSVCLCGRRVSVNICR